MPLSLLTNPAQNGHCNKARVSVYIKPTRVSRRAKQQLVACGAARKPVTTLPNGLIVCYASKYDVSFLYREIFQEQVYLQHGVKLAEGDVVVDVGGNIGFFALFAAQRVGTSGRVITAEPIPVLQEKLICNIQSHQTWCATEGKSRQQTAAASCTSSAVSQCLTMPCEEQTCGAPCLRNLCRSH